MAKKNARISINKLESVLKDNVVTVPMRGCKDVEITIRHTLPLRDMMQFVENVVSACVDAKENRYTPEILEFMIAAEILTSYANFTLPSNAEKQYELVYGTDALEQVAEHINPTQMVEIRTAIGERIEHEVRKMEAVVAEKANELLVRVETMTEQIEALFSGVDSEEFQGVMRNLAQMNAVDEKALARAVLDAQSEKVGAVESVPTEEASGGEGGMISLPKK